MLDQMKKHKRNYMTRTKKLFWCKGAGRQFNWRLPDQLTCLNPCFGGRVLDQMKRGTYKVYVGLNPCFGGRVLDRLSLNGLGFGANPGT